MRGGIWKRDEERTERTFLHTVIVRLGQEDGEFMDKRGCISEFIAPEGAKGAQLGWKRAGLVPFRWGDVLICEVHHGGAELHPIHQLLDQVEHPRAPDDESGDGELPDVWHVFVRGWKNKP